MQRACLCCRPYIWGGGKGLLSRLFTPLHRVKSRLPHLEMRGKTLCGMTGPYGLSYCQRSLWLMTHTTMV
ncbi:hypothetical protein RB213_015016, partial [Colletotrichum asianum]